MLQRLTGKIISWHWSASGDYAFIETPDLKKYFLHRKEIANYVQPVPGSQCEFTPGPPNPNPKNPTKPQLPQALDALVILRKPKTVAEALGAFSGGGR